MLTTIRTRAMEALWPALIGALLAAGLALPIFNALELQGVNVLLGACLLTAVGCGVMGMGGVYRFIGLGIGAALLLFLAITSKTLSNIPSVLGAAVHMLRGDVAPLKVYGPEVGLIAGGLLTLFGWQMARQSAGFYPALSLTMIVLLLQWFAGTRGGMWLLAPALIALCAMFARSVSEETPAPRILLAATAAVLLAVLISPVMQVRSPKLENFADDLREYITDTLFFTEPRSVYSIQADGFKPLTSRLGGPVELDDRPVMTVETPTALLLRGVIYNEYTGLNWTDTLSSRRYLYTDLRNRSLRIDTMDENRPVASVRGQQPELFREANIRITMNSGSASTLFVPQRVSSLETPMPMVPYFNQAGEMFITRNLEAGDSYTLSAPVINAGDRRLSDLLAQTAMGTREIREMEDYLRLHDRIADGVYELTQQITASAGSPYDRARAIQEYLRQNYTYTLTPAMPPDNQDFVSFFLLTGKEGYCTYYATAMSIMGRIAGLPTRYVEGYIADPSGGIALVTSKQAHAWTEVYFDGFGWVAFDATPQGSGGSGSSGGGGESDDDWQDPTQEQQGQDEAQQDANAELDAQGDQAEQSQNPIGGDAHDTPDDPDDPEEEPEDEGKSGRWWAWLLTLAIVGLLGWRWYVTRPAYIAAQKDIDSDRLLVWYRALLGLLQSGRMPARSWETPLAYAARVEQGIPPEAGFLDVATNVTRLGYARDELRESDIRAAAACYSAVWRALPLRAKAIWFARRMLRGIGSIQQVP